MGKEALRKLQDELDVAKWYDSQKRDADACGSYDYCAKCDKEVIYPCAKAKTAFDKKSAKPVSDKVIRLRKSRA